MAVAGFGGLGHMALQYAVKLGADVTVFDITENKRQDALKWGRSNISFQAIQGAGTTYCM